MDFDIKEKVMSILEKTEMAERRPAKMDQHDFLVLLDAFISEGLRFTSWMYIYWNNTDKYLQNNFYRLDSEVVDESESIVGWNRHHGRTTWMKDPS